MILRRVQLFLVSSGIELVWNSIVNKLKTEIFLITWDLQWIKQYQLSRYQKFNSVTALPKVDFHIKDKSGFMFWPHLKFTGILHDGCKLNININKSIPQPSTSSLSGTEKCRLYTMPINSSTEFLCWVHPHFLLYQKWWFIQWAYQAVFSKLKNFQK